MFCCGIVNIVILVAQISFVLFIAHGETLNRTALIENARKLCPYNRICSSGEAVSSATLEQSDGCCTDCSCAETCSISRNCCFASEMGHDQDDGLIQECIFPSTNLLAFQYVQSFSMVVGMRFHGSHENVYCGNESISCGQDTNATALGSLYPVFSPTSGRIYKNMRCAKCHGFNEDDILKWEAVLSCERDPHLPFDISAFYYGFDDGKMDSRCSILFFYPGSFDDIRSDICAQDPPQCLQDDMFDIPDYIDMNHDDIRRACMSGLQSPSIGHMTTYKNVFCTICSYAHGSFQREGLCRNMQDQKGTLSASFTAIIHPDFIKQKSTFEQHKDEEMQNHACRVQKDDHVCRRIYCPTGQVTVGNRNCMYPSKRWNNNEFEIFLKLIPRNPIKESLLKSQYLRSSALDTNWYVSPWADSWKLKAFVYTKPESDRYDAVVSCFFVRLVTKQQTRNVPSIIKSIVRFLKDDWNLFLNGSTFLLNQTLSKFTRFQKLDRTSYKPDMTSPENQMPDFALNVSVPYLLDLTMSNLSPSPYITITKMFFCYQIRLEPTEYQIDIKAKLLFITKSNRILFHGEFSLTLDGNGQYFPHICEEDTEIHNGLLSTGSKTISFCRFPHMFALFVHSVILTMR